MRRLVVKVGGSLYDMPRLGDALSRWVREQQPAQVLLIPGGGPCANVVRLMHRVHGLTEEQSHWLALESLSLAAQILRTLLADVPVTTDIHTPLPLAILTPYPFACEDERNLDSLPHTWDVTTDSLAAQVAHRTGMRELMLLKSLGCDAGCDWRLAADRGYVDRAFPGLVERYGLEVRAVDFRAYANAKGRDSS